MFGNVTGVSGHVSNGLTGFHMNALFALIVVLAFMVGVLFLVDRLKKYMPRFLNKSLPSKGSLSVCDIIQLDSKRKLISVSVKSQKGNKALAILLIGGGNDICVGWLDEASPHPLPVECLETVIDDCKVQKDAPHV